MDILEYMTVQNIIATTGALTGVTGFIFGYRERQLRNKSTKVDILDKLQEYLKDDLEQVHKVNDVLKRRLADQEIEIETLRNETNRKL